jgi:hypothetical protein
MAYLECMNMYGIKLKKRSGYDLLMIVFAYLIVTVSVYISFLWSEPHWFSRSGSIMVLLAVMVEYHNFKVQQKINEKATEGSGTIGGGVGKIGQPKYRQLLSGFTHFTIVLGTLIWGYGDLLIKN